MLAFVAFSPSAGYAQDSIQELETNTNASGKSRTNPHARRAAEFGMGMVGLVTAAASGGLVAAGGLIFSSDTTLYVGLGVVELLVTPITAGLVYQGGRLTGGRAKHWAPYAGGYIGMASALLVGTIGLTFDAGFKGYAIVAGIAIPIFSLIGSMVAYELSDKKETNRLISERDKLTQSSVALRTPPIMFNLISGSF